jgi:hypothetical protein
MKVTPMHPKSLSQWFPGAPSRSPASATADVQGKFANHSPVANCLALPRGEVICIYLESEITDDWRLTRLARVLHRTRLHRPPETDIFLQSKDSSRLNLHGRNSFEVLHSLKAIVPPIILVQRRPHAEFYPLLKVTKLWTNRKPWNFDCLLRFNMNSGCRFQDIIQ